MNPYIVSQYHPAFSGADEVMRIYRQSCADLGLTASNTFTGSETIHDRYTGGMCDIYALALRNVIGGQIVALTIPEGNLVHLIHAALLLDDGTVHDVDRVQPLREFRSRRYQGEKPVFSLPSEEELNCWQGDQDPSIHISEAEMLIRMIINASDSTYYATLARAA